MPEVNYTRVNFENSPSTNTPINAENLNKMDKGISDCTEIINALNTDVTRLKTNLTANNKTFIFGYSGGKYGYYIGSTFYPFKNPTGTKSITANGVFDVTDYASVNVNVNTYLIQDYIEFDGYTEYQAYITRAAYKGYSGVAYLGSSGGNTFVSGGNDNTGGALPYMSYDSITGTVYMNMVYTQYGKIRFDTRYAIPKFKFLLYK